MFIDLRYEKPMSVQDVMDMFSVSRRTVDNWFTEGLERIYMGRRVYTSINALQRFAKCPHPIVDFGELARKQRAAEKELAKIMGPDWTPDQLALLGTMSDAELAEQLGCKKSLVSHHRSRRGIPKFESSPNAFAK